jgi:hypothetical protein
MKSLTLKLSALGLSIALLGGAAQGAEPTPKEAATFVTLRTVSVKEAREQAQTWLKSVGKTDEASQKAFAAIWAETDKPVLDLVADTLALGNADAAKLLADARDPETPAPTEIPSLLKDQKLPSFFRSNLATAYAKSLSNRKVYEEAVEVLKGVRPENVVDPAAYYFHKAVGEHGMLNRLEAMRSIFHLLDDVPDAPDRYRLLAVLMIDDMGRWQDKSLDEISRKMKNVERRLDLARGGAHTQKQEKEIMARLDEMIKKLENQQNQQNQQNSGGCPSGGSGSSPGNSPGNTNTPSAPQQDSMGGTNSGPGKVDQKKLEELAKNWGKLPERERVQAITELKRNMSPTDKALIEEFIKRTVSGNSREGER